MFFKCVNDTKEVNPVEFISQEATQISVRSLEAPGLYCVVQFSLVQCTQCDTVGSYVV